MPMSLFRLKNFGSNLAGFFNRQQCFIFNTLSNFVDFLLPASGEFVNIFGGIWVQKNVGKSSGSRK